MKFANSRLYNIDLLKFILAIFIVYYHITPNMSSYYGDIPLYDTLTIRNMNTGQNGVMSFFLLSGLFFWNPKKFKETKITDFIKQRIQRLWPLLFLSLIINFHSKADFLNLFFINSGTGLLKASSSNPASWFVCVLFWIECFAFSLASLGYLRYKSHITDKWFTLVAGGIAFTGFMMLAQKTNGNGYCEVAYEQIPFLTNGILMGLTGFSFGIIISQLNENIAQIVSLKRYGKFMASALEVLLIGYWIHIFILCKERSELVFRIFICVLLVQDFLMQCGYISKALNRSIFKQLGNWSYAIYIMQFPCFAYLKKTLWKYYLPNTPPSKLLWYSSVY